ncbi:MAG: hypothetical protein M3Y85_01580 [Bacteroidota bacterium]|nr:hypothetical protein [Bacteroidota bacterium]
MKKVVVTVEEERFDFLMELLNSLDFVPVQEQSGSKKEVLQTIAEGMREAFLASQGDAPSRPAKEFLREL